MERLFATVIFAGIGTVGACSAPTSVFTVSVRDAQSMNPIAGAVVVADTPNRNHPFSIASILGRAGPLSVQATTDAQGRASLVGLDDRPVRIGVFADGREPAFGMFAGSSGAEWVGLGDAGSEPRSEIEVRLGP